MLYRNVSFFLYWLYNVFFVYVCRSLQHIDNSYYYQSLQMQRRKDFLQNDVFCTSMFTISYNEKLTAR